jgi:hypothetical protein
MPYLFLKGTNSSKFTEREIIELLEWSVPTSWRAKFDLVGYIPALHSNNRLIEECEAIDRNVLFLEDIRNSVKIPNKISA